LELQLHLPRIAFPLIIVILIAVRGLIVVQIAIPTANEDGEMASEWCEISFRMIATLH
jgi:hypothetical protein